ncbi:hypothetical protein [Nitrosomonas sp.]|uniref:hypothetical protein n=1 Tax=Nitrosomonas sp. TaxID=42353 RepID=UPI002088CA99|nr:hypothetical protein [Nitrosomonas sp.]GJL76960.1 MAG: hypothetical protein NMNS02_30660 [Nitrosomonas sp.]
MTKKRANKPRKLVALFQGAAFAVLCFFSSSLFAQHLCYNSVIEAESACSGSCTEQPILTGHCSSTGNYNTVRFHNGNPPFHYPSNGAKYYPAATYDPSNYDENDCFTYQSSTICAGDDHYEDPNGYDSDGCINGVCPGDPGWTDADGYDEEGFDSNGEDRGGNTAAEGGGYFGGAGSGGTPPHYIDPPIPTDPQNGNNRDGNNVLQCYAAYPITVTKSLLPATVLDGLAGCSNECVYQPQSTIWDFSAGQEVVQLVPTGFVCQGEPAISVVDIITYTPPPMGQEPPEEYDNINACYLNGGYFYCDHPLNDDPADCYRNNGGWIGTEISCQNADENPDVCGEANGVYHCMPESNCQSFSGIIHCIDDFGNYIAFNDPDHITNGGNGNGDSTDDVFEDSADVDANGQSTQERVTQTLDAREFAAQIDAQLRNEFAGLQGSLDSIASGLDELNEGDSTDGQSGLDGLLGRLGDVGTDSELSFDGTVIEPISNLVGNIVPASTGCAQFQYDILPAYSIGIALDTCDLEPAQPLFRFIVYALTLFSLFNIAIGSKEETV